MPSARGLALALALALAGAPSVAEACSCLGDHLESWPEDGATEVPRNAKIWLGAVARSSLAEEALASEDLFELIGPEGDVAITVTEIDSRSYGDIEELSGLWVVSPVEPMMPGLHQLLGGEGPRFGLEFTVGEMSVDEAPPVPEVVGKVYSVSGGRGLWCPEETRMVTLDLAEPADLLVVEQEGGDVLDTEALAGGVADAAPTGDNTFSFGRGGCVYNWLDAERGDDTRIRLGAYDIAGNFSGWSPWIDVNISRGCACSVRSDDPRRASALVFFGVLLLSRRRAPR